MQRGRCPVCICVTEQLASSELRDSFDKLSVLAQLEGPSCLQYFQSIFISLINYLVSLCRYNIASQNITVFFLERKGFLLPNNLCLFLIVLLWNSTFNMLKSECSRKHQNFCFYRGDHTHWRSVIKMHVTSSTWQLLILLISMKTVIVCLVFAALHRVLIKLLFHKTYMLILIYLYRSVLIHYICFLVRDCGSSVTTGQHSLHTSLFQAHWTNGLPLLCPFILPFSIKFIPECEVLLFCQHCCHLQILYKVSFGSWALTHCYMPRDN